MNQHIFRKLLFGGRSSLCGSRGVLGCDRIILLDRFKVSCHSFLPQKLERLSILSPKLLSFCHGAWEIGCLKGLYSFFFGTPNKLKKEKAFCDLPDEFPIMISMVSNIMTIYSPKKTQKTSQNI